MRTQPKNAPSNKTLWLTVLVVGLFTNLAACHQSPLHRSYALRYREVMAAQANAHPSREPVTRGEESAKAVRNYFDHYDSMGGQNGAPKPQGQPTAGIMPMH